jgi:hypothetical protein
LFGEEPIVAQFNGMPRSTVLIKFKKRKISLLCGHILQEVTINSVAQSKTHLRTTEVKKRHIKEHGSSNMPTKYKSRYKELILKHFKTFS